MSDGHTVDGTDRVVDWSALQHAHGPATDVPKMLEGLLSADAGTREAALEALYGALWSQDAIWPATAAAIPSVLRLVDADTTPDRALLVLFLADIGRIASLGDEPWYADALGALAAGVPVLLRRLGRADEVERIAATVALAWADDGSALRERLAGGDEAERLVTLYGLVAGRVTPTAELLAPWADAADPAIQLAARIGLARAGVAGQPGDVEPEAYALLAEVTSTVAPQGLPQPVELLDPAVLTAHTVRALSGVLQISTGARVALPLVESLLEAAMPDGWEEPPTPLQEVVLHAICNSPGAWTFEANTLAALAEHGVDVVDRLDLCARLGLDADDLPEPEDTQSILAGSDRTGIRWEELSADQRRDLDRFVWFLDQRGWNESKNWHAFVTSGSGLPITPIGVGRHFNANAVLEVTLWFFDEHVADDTGERVGDPYVRLLIADKAEREEPIGYRCYYGERLEQVLEVLDRHRPTVDRKNFAEKLPRDLFDVCPRVEVEVAGRVIEIRPKSKG